MTYRPSGDVPDPYQPEHLYGKQPERYGQRGSSARPGRQPGPVGRPARVPVARTNTLAILALVVAFLFAPAAIVLGRKAKRQILRTGERGESLASAGLALGYIFTALFLFGCLLLVIGALLSGSRDIA